MARPSALLLCALLGTCLALPAAAQWKWRSTGGQIQYSDLPPPPGVADRDILQRPSGNTGRNGPVAPVAATSSEGAASTPSLAPKGTDPELEAKRKKAEQEQADKVKADEQKVAAARAENCNRARAHMRTLESGVRLTRVNDKGEREVLEDAQRNEEINRTRAVMTSDCR
jgi:hypothetical protein